MPAPTDPNTIYLRAQSCILQVGRVASGPVADKSTQFGCTGVPLPCRRVSALQFLHGLCLVEGQEGGAESVAPSLLMNLHRTNPHAPRCFYVLRQSFQRLNLIKSSSFSIE